MDMNNNEQIVAELKSAMAFIGQAQGAAVTGSKLWNELGTMYDAIDGMVESIQEGYYD